VALIVRLRISLHNSPLKTGIWGGDAMRDIHVIILSQNGRKKDQ
jgi:hypothetical protein